MEGNGKSAQENAIKNWYTLMQSGRVDYQNYRLKSAAKFVITACANYGTVITAAKSAHGQNLNSSSSSYNADPQHGQKLNACSSSLKHNALGCIYFRMNKPNLALVYFGKAINDYTIAVNLALADANANSKQPSIYCRNFYYRLSLLHNCGVALLQIKQPAAAFDCLMEVVTVINTNARLWLRLAECCIMANKMSNRTDFELNERKRNIIKDIVGVGPHRKIVLNTTASGIKFSTSGEQGAIPALSLEFAHFCLKNALATLPDFDPDSVTTVSESSEVKGQLQGGGDNGGGSTANPFDLPTSTREKHSLKCSILCATTYVCLCLGDTYTALQSAKSLLNQKLLPDTQKILVHLYAAESLILSDKIAEAINFLKIDPPTNGLLSLSIPPPPSPANGNQSMTSSSSSLVDATYFPRQSQTFKTILYYNLAAAYAHQQEFDKASQTLALISDQSELPIQFTMLALYIQIQRGQIEEARNVVMKTLMHSPSPFS